jgi:hypothetical protein
VKKSGRKQKTPPPIPEPRPMKKLKHKPTLKESSQVQKDESDRKQKTQPKHSMLNYFEEIEINGGSRLVYIHDLTDDVAHFLCAIVNIM